MMDNNISIFEITYPGDKIAIENHENVKEIKHMIRLMESQFRQAVIALNLFRTKNANSIRSEQRTKKIDDQEMLRQKLNKKYQKQYEDNLTIQSRFKVQKKIEREILRHQWKTSKVPLEYEVDLLLIYAHAYVYALDGFAKILNKLKKINEKNSTRITNLYDMFVKNLPLLKGVRDSALHIENRGRRRDRHDKLIPTNLFVYRVLSNNGLMYTTEKGNNAEIEINQKNTELVRQILQKVINSFDWTGLPRTINF